MIILTIVDEDGNEEFQDATGLEAKETIRRCLLDGKLWEVDYSQATHEEHFHWFTCDFYYRSYRAINFRGVAVYIDGIEHRDIAEAAVTIGMAFQTGLGVVLVEDDERGMVIETAVRGEE